MKAIIAILALLAVCSAEPLYLDVNPFADNPAVEYVKGFLLGVHEPKQIEDLMKCMGNMDPIFAKLKEAMEHFMKFNFEEVIAGLKVLKEAMIQLYEMLAPCLDGFEQLKKLVEAMKNWNIIKIATKMIANAVTFVKDIKECVESLQKGDFYTAGKDTGDILYRLFLVRDDMDGIVIADFLRGFLQGLNEQGDINELLKCTKDLEDVIKKILEAFKLISQKTIDAILGGVVILIQAVKEMLAILKPCSEGFTQIKKLFEALKNISLIKIAMKILADMSTYYRLVKDFIDCISHDSTQAGKDLGEFLYRLFLSGEEVIME